MKFTSGLVLAAILFLPYAQAANKDIQELQRELLTLQEQVRSMQRALEDRMTEMRTLVQQNLDASTKTNTSLAVLENGVGVRMAEQAKNLTGPVATMGTKIDQLSTDFQSVREGLTDLTARMGKLQQQVTDLDNTLKVMQTPPALPGAPATGAAGAPPAGMSAKQLWDSAMRDRSGGNLDLALQSLDAYLKYYGTTELAPDAQFYIGQIYYDKADFANALKGFDAVLERYSENSRTADAAYMKGLSLLKSGQATAAGREFLTVIQKYPNSEAAMRARTQRRALGLSVPAATPAKSSTRRRG